jgi:ADP-heptose:LPS heptosyltransferase
MIYFACMSDKVKILIIRFSSIGDIVLCTPVIRCLKNQIEGEAEIHFITKAQYRPILEHNPYLDQIHTIDKTTDEVIDELKAIEFDYVIDLHHNLRSARIKSRLKALHFSFNKLNIQKWLLVNFKMNRMPNVHIVDRYMETTKALGIENDGQGLDYFLPPDLQPAELPANFSSNYQALVLAATHNTKRPLEKHYQKLLAGIQKPMILIGGKAEAEMGERLAKLHPDKVLNMAGKSSLAQSALLIRNAQLVITPDTGMMHIAAAFDKPILSIWGNTVPEFGMYPYYAKDSKNQVEIYEVKDLGCRPCSKIGYAKCPKGHFKCMENQEWDGLALRANQM